MRGASALMSLPVSGMSSLSLIPDQNEPKASQARPSDASIRNGSMALKSSPCFDITTMPRSCQPSPGFKGSNAVLVMSPIALALSPKLDRQ